MVKVQMEVQNLTDLGRVLADITQAVVHPQTGIVDALEQGLQVTVERARDYVRENFDTTGEFPKKIKTRKVNQYRVDLLADAVYAAVHEYGLDKQPITERQRAFFWWMYTEVEPENEMWKWLALSETYTIPARPYMRPAIDETKDQALRDAAWALRHTIAKAVR